MPLALRHTPPPATAVRDASPRTRLLPLRWVLLGCLALAALSLLLPSAPTYDPIAWLIWGREIAELDLNTRQGPSWKPLPVIFTTLFAPAGEGAADLWLLIGRAGALLALAMSYRVAARIAGRLAGVAAAVSLVLTSGFVRNGALGNSEPLLVGLVLWGVERHLDGRRMQALLLGCAAGLLRPEVWPFLGLYGLWLLVRRHAGLLPLVALGAGLLALWFLPEWWGSGDALRASNRALEPNPDSPAFAERPALALLAVAWPVLILPVKVGIVAAVAVALSRRRTAQDRVVLVLAAGALAILALVAVMTEVGYSGNSRYLLLPAALGCVLGGVGIARLLGAGAALRRAAPGDPLRRALAVALPVALLLGAAPFVVTQIQALDRAAWALNFEAELYDELPQALELAGGREGILACGTPYTGEFEVPQVAWRLDLHIEQVGIAPEPPGWVFRARPYPGRTVRPPTGPPFRLVGRTDNWQVGSACPPLPAGSLG